MYGINSPTYLTALTNLSFNQWYHIVWTYDANGGSNNRRIYINGILNNSDTKTGNYNTTYTSFTIGIYNSSWPWDGYIKSANIYNRALSSQEILSMYQSGHTSLWSSGFGINVSSGNET